MTTTKHTDGESQRLASSIRLVLRRYGTQLRRRPAMTAGALLPANTTADPELVAWGAGPP